MLADMQAKAKEERNAEEVAFSKFTTWCSMESSHLNNDIASEGEDIETLSAEIVQLDSEAKGLGGAIGKLQSDIASFEADKEKATKQRAKDNAAFLVESQDYAESVDAVARALDVMQSENYDRGAKAASLMQITDANDAVGATMPAKVRSIVAAFVGMMDADDSSAASPPEANAYEFQSGGVVTLLKKLQDEFREKLGECQKEEANSKHAYDMVHQDLIDSAASATKDISEKSTEKLRKEQQSAANTKQHDETVAMKASDEKILSDMTTECDEKKMSFEEKQQLRAEEIEAIGNAMEILQTPEAAGNAEKHLSLAQQKKTALVQMKQSNNNAGADANSRSEGIRRKIREFLESEGKRLHSDRIGLLAVKLASDPFAKVKKMIDGMITRLLEEANQDASHEGFCDEEIGKSKITRNKLTEDIDGLKAAMEAGKSNILGLAQRMATNTAEVADLNQAMAEAMTLRQTEKAQNVATIADAKAGQKAVASAIAVLKEFYEKAGGTTALIQTSRAAGPVGHVKMGGAEWASLANPAFEGSGGYTTGIASSKVDKGHQDGMQTFGAQYQGNQDAAGGVLALLDVILSDFNTLEADTSAAEDASDRNYKAFQVESQRNAATKSKQVEMDTADKANAQARLQEDTADWKANQDELLAAERYHAKLVPQCMDPGQTFEERTASREAEITSLKEALKILNSGDVA